jgi:hypothetical protein
MVRNPHNKPIILDAIIGLLCEHLLHAGLSKCTNVESGAETNPKNRGAETSPTTVEAGGTCTILPSAN